MCEFIGPEVLFKTFCRDEIRCDDDDDDDRLSGLFISFPSRALYLCLVFVVQFPHMILILLWICLSLN